MSEKLDCFLCVSLFLVIVFLRHTCTRKKRNPAIIPSCVKQALSSSTEATDFAGNTLQRFPASILQLKLEILLYARISLRESCWWVTQVGHKFSLVLHLKWFPLQFTSCDRMIDSCCFLIFFACRFKPNIYFRFDGVEKDCCSNLYAS